MFNGPIGTPANCSQQIQGRVVIDPLSYLTYISGEMNLDAAAGRPSLDGTDEGKSSVGESDRMGCGRQACSIQLRENILVKFHRYSEIDPLKRPPPRSQEYFFLCDHKTPGMVLKSRKWGT